MNETNRIVEIFDELQALGLVINRKEMAAKMGVNYTNFIGAMKGYERNLTPQMVSRAEALRRELLDGTANNAQAPARKKEITIPAETLELYTNLSRTAAQLAETLDRLLAAERGKKDAAG